MGVVGHSGLLRQRVCGRKGREDERRKVSLKEEGVRIWD